MVGPTSIDSCCIPTEIQKLIQRWPNIVGFMLYTNRNTIKFNSWSNVSRTSKLPITISNVGPIYACLLGTLILVFAKTDMLGKLKLGCIVMTTVRPHSTRSLKAVEGERWLPEDPPDINLSNYVFKFWNRLVEACQVAREIWSRCPSQDE